MKTSKIISTSITFSLIFLMSVISIANSNISTTGDIIKTGDKKQIGETKKTNIGMISPAVSANEFSRLRFDVNKLNIESEINELPFHTTDYLHFDVNNFTKGTTPELMELPLMNEFEYLRFDVNKFGNNNENSEMPVK